MCIILYEHTYKFMVCIKIKRASNEGLKNSSTKSYIRFYTLYFNQKTENVQYAFSISKESLRTYLQYYTIYIIHCNFSGRISHTQSESKKNLISTNIVVKGFTLKNSLFCGKYGERCKGCNIMYIKQYKVIFK